ncbi:GlsB/YeaQ/YmgE family stress response membrane protein [uncultured Tessaracoccus sp.]|uniref:GlsB/YeaQ/YmgE family stress response membrane protein n=1 Tax=uncultured Tessaracoccus sp. TaxID=905023 RepID=UPI002624C1CF|nr:GlsB/YeaQ/YmgE family stress response membrane protein [uncultured Tessaracoccus sp.]
MFTLIAYLIVGAVAGAIAKALVPGEQGGGFFMTALLGIVGAFVGGLLGQFAFGDKFDKIWSFSGLVTAIIGAVVVLLVYGFLTKKKA